METMLDISRVLRGTQEALCARKLQTALFIAQEQSGVQLYAYTLRQGKVLSDELDQDLAQLGSAGFLATSVSIADGSTDLTFYAPPGFGDKSDRPANPVLGQLAAMLNNQEDVLEAAATLMFFTNHYGREPNGELSWFRELPQEVISEARELCEQTRRTQ